MPFRRKCLSFGVWYILLSRLRLAGAFLKIDSCDPRRQIMHLNGKNLTITNTTDVTKMGQIIRLDKQGMPRPIREDIWGSIQPVDYGNLYVNVKVRLPSKLKPNTRQKIKELLKG